MSELKNLSAILEGGAVPAGYNGKAIGKLSKTYLKLENRKVVNLYPIRTVMHEDSRYCLYACPLKGTEIDEATLQSIKAEVDTLEIGEIRYDSVQSCGYWKSHATLTLLATQDLPTFGYNMIDPLKSWCWGSILFYPFKISRFS